MANTINMSTDNSDDTIPILEPSDQAMTGRQPPPIPHVLLPYATPAQYIPVHAGGQIWREGTLVVAPKNPVFPARCVKCNAPAVADWRWKKKLSWHHPSIYITLPLGVLIYAIIAMSVSKSSTLIVGLCPMHRSRHRKRILLGWLVAVGGIIVLIVGCALSTDPSFKSIKNLGVVCLILGIAMILFSLFWAALGVNVLSAKKITDTVGWYKGAGDEFLDSLPGNAG